MQLYCKHIFLTVTESGAKVLIDTSFPRLIFSLTLAFRALTEKQPGVGVSDAEAGCLLGSWAGLAWECFGWMWGGGGGEF